jgi:hypothetical protein
MTLETRQIREESGRTTDRNGVLRCNPSGCPESKASVPAKTQVRILPPLGGHQMIMWSLPPSLHPHKLGLTLHPEALFGNIHPSKPLGPRPEVWQFCSPSCVSPQLLCTLENCRVPE